MRTASPPSGFFGQELRVDLDRGTVSAHPLDEATLRLYPGGMALGTRILCDAAGSREALVFAAGALTGTLAPCSGRLDASFHSPLTGMLGSANAGGFFAPALRSSGFQALTVTGRSPRPVALVILEGVARLEPADDAWGLSTWDASDRLRRAYPGARVLAIGPAGEKSARVASITVDYCHSLSRGGPGAVMGKKNLKAIVARGNRPIPVARPRVFWRLARRTVDETDPWPRYAPDEYRAHSISAVRRYLDFGDLPGRNFQTGVLAGWEKRLPGAAAAHLRPVGEACYCCHLSDSCAVVRGGRHDGLRVADLHNSFILSFGALCAVEDLPAIWRLQALCEQFGLDATSAAGTVGWAMELYERGLLTEREIGRPLRWGNEDDVAWCLGRMARREGIGDVLADGSLEAARRIGRGTERYTATVAGMEIYPMDPRVGSGVAWQLGHLTSQRGGDNVKSTHVNLDRAPLVRPLLAAGMSQEEFEEKTIAALDMDETVKRAVFGRPPRFRPYDHAGKAHLMVWLENMAAATNTLGVCLLLRLGPTRAADFLAAATGWDVDAAGLLIIGERVVNLQRLYNMRQGHGRAAMRWPRRFLEEEIPDGPGRGRRIDVAQVERTLDEYMRLRDWSLNAAGPSPQKLSRLGIEAPSNAGRAATCALGHDALMGGL